MSEQVSTPTSTEPTATKCNCPAGCRCGCQSGGKCKCGGHCGG